MAAAAGRPRRGGILREGYDYTFSRCDPATGAHVDPAWCAVYETATVADSEGRLGPSLATDWRQSPDGAEWRFRIRPEARYHSGRRCDATTTWTVGAAPGGADAAGRASSHARAKCKCGTDPPVEGTWGQTSFEAQTPLFFRSDPPRCS